MGGQSGKESASQPSCPRPSAKKNAKMSQPLPSVATLPESGAATNRTKVSKAVIPNHIKLATRQNSATHSSPVIDAEFERRLALARKHIGSAVASKGADEVIRRMSVISVDDEDFQERLKIVQQQLDAEFEFERRLALARKHIGGAVASKGADEVIRRMSIISVDDEDFQERLKMVQQQLERFTPVVQGDIQETEFNERLALVRAHLEVSDISTNDPPATTAEDRATHHQLGSRDHSEDTVTDDDSSNEAQSQPPSEYCPQAVTPLEHVADTVTGDDNNGETESHSPSVHPPQAVTPPLQLPSLKIQQLLFPSLPPAAAEHPHLELQDEHTLHETSTPRVQVPSAFALLPTPRRSNPEADCSDSSSESTTPRVRVPEILITPRVRTPRAISLQP